MIAVRLAALIQIFNCNNQNKCTLAYFSALLPSTSSWVEMFDSQHPLCPCTPAKQDLDIYLRNIIGLPHRHCPSAACYTATDVVFAVKLNCVDLLVLVLLCPCCLLITHCQHFLHDACWDLPARLVLLASFVDCLACCPRGCWACLWSTISHSSPQLGPVDARASLPGPQSA